ncbi:MAG: hypothetical protein AB1469_03455 [Pseudomonadota bacterium]
MKTLDVAMVRIYIPNDEAHLERVLAAIDDFGPGGDVNIFEVRPALDADGKRLPSTEKKSLMVEFFEETCRAQMFVDAFHEDLMPCRLLGWTMLMLEGDSYTQSQEQRFKQAEAGSND